MSASTCTPARPVAETATVIIPALDAASTLPRVLASLTPLPQGWQIILVDDGSRDGTPELARASGVTVLASEGHASDCAARNTGARHSSADILVFLDADVVTSIEDLEQAVARVPMEDLGCLFAIYDRGNHLSGMVSRYKNFWIRHSTLKAPRPLRWVNSSLMILRRSTFEQAGGFREDLSCRHGGGDLEFGHRVASLGQPVVADEGFQVCHIKHFSLARLWRNDRLRAQGWLRLQCDRRGLWAVAQRPTLANVSARFSYGVVATAMAAVLAIGSLWWPLLAWLAAGALGVGTAFNGDFLVAAARARIRGWPAFACLIWFDQLACAVGITIATMQCICSRRQE